MTAETSLEFDVRIYTDCKSYFRVLYVMDLCILPLTGNLGNLLVGRFVGVTRFFFRAFLQILLNLKVTMEKGVKVIFFSLSIDSSAKCSDGLRRWRRECIWQANERGIEEASEHVEIDRSRM